MTDEKKNEQKPEVKSFSVIWDWRPDRAVADIRLMCMWLLCSGVNLSAGSSRWLLDLGFRVFCAVGTTVNPFQTERGDLHPSKNVFPVETLLRFNIGIYSSRSLTQRCIVYLLYYCTGVSDTRDITGRYQVRSKDRETSSTQTIKLYCYLKREALITVWLSWFQLADTYT